MQKRGLLLLAGLCLLVRFSGLATVVEITLGLPTWLGVGGAWLLPISWIRFLTRKSLKSRCIYFAPHEDNRIQLLSAVRSRRWKNHFNGTLEGMLAHRIAVGHTIRIVAAPHVPVYTIPQCEASQGSCYHQKNFILVVGLCWSACILLVCPSKPTQWYFPSFLPVRLPFSISVFWIQSQGVCLFCLAVPYRMSLFSLSLSHLKVLVMKK